MEKEFSSVGKDVFLRRKEFLRSKGKDLRRVLKKANRGAGYTRPPIRSFRCSTGKSGATPVEGRWKCYCFFSGVGLVMKTRLSAGTRALNHCWSLACSGAGSALPDSSPRSTAMVLSDKSYSYPKDCLLHEFFALYYGIIVMEGVDPIDICL